MIALVPLLMSCLSSVKADAYRTSENNLFDLDMGTFETVRNFVKTNRGEKYMVDCKQGCKCDVTLYAAPEEGFLHCELDERSKGSECHVAFTYKRSKENDEEVQTKCYRTKPRVRRRVSVKLEGGTSDKSDSSLVSGKSMHAAAGGHA